MQLAVMESGPMQGAGDIIMVSMMTQVVYFLSVEHGGLERKLALIVCIVCACAVCDGLGMQLICCM